MFLEAEDVLALSPEWQRLQPAAGGTLLDGVTRLPKQLFGAGEPAGETSQEGGGGGGALCCAYSGDAIGGAGDLCCACSGDAGGCSLLCMQWRCCLGGGLVHMQKETCGVLFCAPPYTLYTAAEARGVLFAEHARVGLPGAVSSGDHGIIRVAQAASCPPPR